MRILFSKNLILPLHSTPHVYAINEVVDEENVVAGDGGAEELDEAKLVATADNGKAFNGDHTLFPQHSKKKSSTFPNPPRIGCLCAKPKWQSTPTLQPQPFARLAFPEPHALPDQQHQLSGG
jgi:hypothetical protein